VVAGNYDQDSPPSGVTSLYHALTLFLSASPAIVNHDGHTISSKLTRRISAGSIMRLHVGQTVFIAARKWEQSLE
jgi:hypothetical protein